MASAASTLLFAESSNRSTDNSQFSTLNSQFVSDSLALEEVVVTGTRTAMDVRHLPMTVTVIDRDLLTAEHQTNVLPTVMREVPGLFVTSRSMLGYGVSGGAAGGINLRGISGGAGQLLVLIDGHPQYQGIYGHPIADSYQTMIAERVEVLRGPASMLYGSNAMGGVLNIVTRQAMVNGQRSTVNVGAGSYGTVQAEASNQVRSGTFSSTIAAQYGRTDNHRPNMGFEQYGGNLNLGYDLNENWKASLSGNVTHWNASNPGAESQLKLENNQWITRGEVSATLSNNYGCTSGALSVYSNFGVSLPRTAYAQSTVGYSVPVDQIQAGDIISYGYNGNVSHSALYIGDNTIVHASTPALGIRTDSMYIMPIVSVRRVAE